MQPSFLAVAKLTDATIVNERNHISRSATIGGRKTIFFCGTQRYIARSTTIGGRATIFFVVAKLAEATINQSKKRYSGATILVGSATIFQSFEDVHPKYGIMVEGARSRRLACRAQYRRILHNDPEYRAGEQVADMERHVIAPLDPEYRGTGK